MKKVIILILSAIILNVNSISAQDFVQINGRVLDGSSGKPVYLASISLLKSNISNISNSEGVFSLKIPADRDYLKDTILITYLGFQRTIVPVASFFDRSKKTLNISLTPAVYMLDPALITPRDARAIFDKAFANVEENYSNIYSSMTAFYREMILKGTRRYLSLNESIVDISKAPVRSEIPDVIGLYKGRGVTNIEKDDSLFIQLQGGAVSSISLDIVKDPFIGVFQNDVHDFYDFILGDPVMLNQKSFHQIHFQQKPQVRETLFRGTMYIETQTFAIAHIEFYMNIENNPDAWRYFVRKKSPDTDYNIDKAFYLVNYKQDEEGVWNFSYSKIELLMSTKKRRSLFKRNFSIIAELAVTDIEKGRLKIDRQDRIRMSDIIHNKVNDYTDENFWEGYNIIEPDESIENIINRITRQLKRESR